MDCVLLFDIDGTLVTCTGPTSSAGIRAMDYAAFEMTGRSGLASQIDFAGATDLRVARELLQLGGVSNPDCHQMEALLSAYVRHLAGWIQEDTYIALGDPASVIPKLKEAGAIVGLATGNVRPGAAFKLDCSGLSPLFDLERGGYGEDGEDRSEIVRAAVERCDPGRQKPVIVIGDTIHDIRAGRLIGCLSVGVPFGKYTAAMLLEEGANAIVDAVDERLVPVLYRLLTKWCPASMP